MKNKLFNFKEHFRLNILILIAVVAAVLVFTGHTTHIFVYSSYLLLFACLLMHLLMHSGHGGHGKH